MIRQNDTQIVESAVEVLTDGENNLAFDELTVLIELVLEEHYSRELPDNPPRMFGSSQNFPWSCSRKSSKSKFEF